MPGATVQCEICRKQFWASSIEEVMDDLNEHREKQHGIKRKEVEEAEGDDSISYMEQMRRQRERRELNELQLTKYDREMLAGMKISAK
jgi:predicted small metal-binding protein